MDVEIMSHIWSNLLKSLNTVQKVKTNQPTNQQRDKKDEATKVVWIPAPLEGKGII